MLAALAEADIKKIMGAVDGPTSVAAPMEEEKKTESVKSLLEANPFGLEAPESRSDAGKKPTVI